MYITIYQIGLLSLILPVTGECSILIYYENSLLIHECSAAASISQCLSGCTCTAHTSLVCQLCT